MWDCRDDNNRLYSLAQISLRGVYDAQLEEAGCRRCTFQDTYHHINVMEGIEKDLDGVVPRSEIAAIEKAKRALHSITWSTSEEPCEHISDPEGSQRWARRPLCHCADIYSKDVVCMALLHKIFMDFLMKCPKTTEAIRAWTEVDLEWSKQGKEMESAHGSREERIYTTSSTALSTSNIKLPQDDCDRKHKTLDILYESTI